MSKEIVESLYRISGVEVNESRVLNGPIGKLHREEEQLVHELESLKDLDGNIEDKEREHEIRTRLQEIGDKLDAFYDDPVTASIDPF